MLKIKAHGTVPSEWPGQLMVFLLAPLPFFRTLPECPALFGGKEIL
jgi:hypothetical protein